MMGDGIVLSKAPERKFVIAVHAGAGEHSRSTERFLLRELRRAMLEAPQTAGAQGSVDLAARAVARMEDCPLTNAGLGSSLNVVGDVECDASIVYGRDPSTFAVMTGLRRVKNPVEAVRKLLETKSCSVLPHGLVPAGILAGEGANRFCEHACLDHADLTTSSTRKAWSKYRNLIDMAPPSMETVGAVAIGGIDGFACAAASSGGSWMKPAGRVGAAGCFGVGCHAKGRIGVAVSGQGESLIASMAAYEIVRHLSLDSADEIPKLLDGCDAGAIGINGQGNTDHITVSSPYVVTKATTSLFGLSVLCCRILTAFIEQLLWTHSSASMAIGYFSSGMEKPVAFISRNRGVEDARKIPL